MTGTDILVYEIKINDVYEDFYKDKHLFDMNNYPKDSKLFDTDNEKVIGKMKDTSKEKISDEFVELRPTMYSIKDVDVKENEEAKGVNKYVVKNVTHNEFVDVLFNKEVVI